MKKIFSVLLLALTLSLFTGCIFVGDVDYEPPKYTLYFFNDTSNKTIYDWFLKDDDGENHVKSDNYVPVEPGEISSISGLKKDYYQVWFCVYSATNRQSDVYVHTENFVYVDSDTTFKLDTESYVSGRPRSATGVTEAKDKSNYVLIDSKGNVYPLVQEVKR